MLTTKGYRLSDGKRMDSKLSKSISKKEARIEKDKQRVLNKIKSMKGRHVELLAVVDIELKNQTCLKYIDILFSYGTCKLSDFKYNEYKFEMSHTPKDDYWSMKQLKKSVISSDYLSVLKRWIDVKEIIGVNVSRGGPFDSTTTMY